MKSICQQSNKIFYSYKNFLSDVKKIGKQVPDEVDTIVAISRGGMTLGHFLSEHLNIRKLFAINTISYNGMKKLKKIEVFGVPDLNKSKTVLIVDDISDSGRTLKFVIKELKNRYPKINFLTATIFYGKNSKFKPDIFIHKSKKWIDFFWTEDILKNV